MSPDQNTSVSIAGAFVQVKPDTSSHPCLTNVTGPVEDAGEQENGDLIECVLFLPMVEQI